MEKKEISYINVIPLVDIMIVLLTIVLISASFIVQGNIPVNLPEAESSQKSKKTKEIALTITKEGEIYINKRRVSIKELKKEVEKLPQNTDIIIRADKDAKVDILIKVLDVLNMKNFKSVGIAVKVE